MNQDIAKCSVVKLAYHRLYLLKGCFKVDSRTFIIQKIKKLSAILVLCIVVCDIAACGDKKDNIVGKWTGTLKLPNFSPINVAYQFYADGTEEYSNMPPYMQVSTKGKYVIIDHKIVVTPTKSTLSHLPPQRTYSYSVDGNTLTLDQITGKSAHLVLKRQ